jgi:cation diffusion facilitator family transporter
LIQVGLLGLISLFIVVEVGARLATDFTLAVSGAALIIIVVTLVVDWLVARYLAAVARRHHSFALEADAYHFTTDFWGKIAVIAGLTAALIGQKWVDLAAALVVAGLMLYTGWRLGHRSTQVLLDTAPRDSLQSRVREILVTEAGDSGFHSLRMRQAGKWVLLDVALHLPPQMSIAEGHERAHRLCHRPQEEIAEVREAVVHIEPEDTHHE